MRKLPANWRPTASDFCIAWVGTPLPLPPQCLRPSCHQSAWQCVSQAEAQCAARCKFVSRCRSKRIATTIERGDYFSVSQVLLSAEKTTTTTATTVAAAFCPAAANGTSCDCGCDFIMQIDSCCGFSTKPPLSARRSASLSLLFLSLSLWLALSPCLCSPPLSWIIAQSSSVCCPRFGPRFARLSLPSLPALPLWSSLAGFVASSLCWQLFSAKFGQQRKKVFTLQRTLVPYGAGRREKEVERGETECTLRQISCKKMWWFLNEKYLLILKEKGEKV